MIKWHCITDLFERVEFCSNRARTALAILTFRGLLHLFKINNCTRHITPTKGKPRAAGFAVSTDVRCRSPELGVLAVLILLFYATDTAPTIVKKP